MKVLMISGDSNALSEKSDAYARLLLQAGSVERLDVLVRGGLNARLELKGRGEIVRLQGSKVSVAFQMLLWPRRGYDVVTAQDPFFLGCIGWLISLRLGAKLQLQLHTDVYAQEYIRFSMANRIRSYVARMMLGRAHGVRVVSARIKKSLPPSVPLFVLPLYVSYDDIQNTPEKILPGAHRKKVLIVSRLEREKGVDDGIRAFAALRKSIQDAGLYIVGDGSERAALEELVHDLGLEECVTFMGQQPALGFYKNANVVLVPSHYEGYGVVIIEALASGCPVVTSDVGVAREAGARVVPREAFASELSAVLSQPSSGALLLTLYARDTWASEWARSLEEIVKTR